MMDTQTVISGQYTRAKNQSFVFGSFNSSSSYACNEPRCSWERARASVVKQIKQKQLQGKLINDTKTNKYCDRPTDKTAGGLDGATDGGSRTGPIRKLRPTLTSTDFCSPAWMCVTNRHTERG